MNNLRVSGMSDYGKKTTITLKFNDEGILQNPQSLARSSLIGWGLWQTSKKIKSEYGSLWNVQTGGHGGFILITQKPIDFMKAAYTIDYTFYIGKSLNVKVYAYEFEEDCNYAIILSNDKIAFNDYCKVYLKESEKFKTIEEVKQFLNECIKNTLKSEEEYKQRGNQKRELLESGAFLRCSAISKENKVKVTFRNKDKIEKDYLMAHKTYHSISLMTNASIEDYQKIGKLEAV